MDKSRRFHKLIRKCWHEFHKLTDPYYMCRLCKDKFGKHREFVESTAHNPNYAADPRLVLREMMKREDWIVFAKKYFHWQTYDKLNLDIDIPIDYILDTTGKLRDVAIDFIEGREKE